MSQAWTTGTLYTMKIVTVVGARPQFIKAAPFSRAVRQRHTEILVHTGQHYDPQLSDVFFDELRLPRPDHHLGIGSGPHGRQTGQMLERIEDVLSRERPDAVVIYGDTNSTLAGALAAAKAGIPLAHVEAGLRSFVRDMPEEINRIVADRVSTWLFAPTNTAIENLRTEGYVGGEPPRRPRRAPTRRRLPHRRHHVRRPPAELSPRAGAIVRSSNTRAAARALRPRDRPPRRQHRRCHEPCGDLRCARPPARARDRPAASAHESRPHGHRHRGRTPVRIVDPVGYLDMLQLQRNARVVLTDSGGVQKEAYLLGVPCVTLRDETEWPETLAGGRNVLAGADCEVILRAARRPRPAAEAPQVFGDGHAAERMVAILEAGSCCRKHDTALGDAIT